MQKVVIIGAGVTGISSALELSKQNYEIVLYDKHNPLLANTSFGRSFNYTINLRGKAALKKLGVWEKVKQVSTTLCGRTFHSKGGEIRQDYGVGSDAFLYSIPRNKLIKILGEKIGEQENIKLQFNKEITNITYDKQHCYTNSIDRTSGIENTFISDFIIAADGVHSQVRNTFAKQLEWDKEIFPWSYTEFNLNALEVKANKLQLDNIHIWSTIQSLWVGIPNRDNSISLLYCAPKEDKEFLFKANKSFNRLFTSVKIENCLDKEQIIGELISIKLNKWYIEDKIIFLGDSAHGIFPFYGQGMNAALEDSRILKEMLERYPFSRQTAFKIFFSIRKQETDILFQLSKNHFIVLKDKGKTIFYNASHKLDFLLHRLFPKLWYHEYNMMSNSLVDIMKISRHLKFQKLAWLCPVYWIGILWMTFIEVINRSDKHFKSEKS
jgi:2-polyprenyl-6-methoxyphenol hydroxylase-like FAD-dependent oxidoreductase